MVNVTSVSGLRATKAQALYGISKSAVTYLTQSAATEVGKRGIRINEIAPALLMPGATLPVDGGVLRYNAGSG